MDCVAGDGQGRLCHAVSYDERTDMDGLSRHSALLSSGRGRGRYWPPPQGGRHCREYAAVAEELGALLAAVQAGVWARAGSFAAGCLPYLSC